MGFADDLLQELTDVFQRREKRLKQAEAALDDRAKHFEDENKQMTTVQVADNDIVDMNVGETIVSTKRSTLTQAKGSSLAARFSGRWKQSLDRDAQGRVCLDFDPYCFQIILTYLRARCMDSTLGRITPSPAVTLEKEHEYQGLIKYLGLEDYMGYSQGALRLTDDQYPLVLLVSLYASPHKVQLEPITAADCATLKVCNQPYVV
ncbi:hypothetical protein WJX79_009892 [Trebouxia sp. C0005]